MPVLPRCLAKAAAQAEWMLLTQLSSSTWHGACQYFAHVVTANIIAGERRVSGREVAVSSVLMAPAHRS